MRMPFRMVLNFAETGIKKRPRKIRKLTVDLDDDDDDDDIDDDDGDDDDDDDDATMTMTFVGKLFKK